MSSRFALALCGVAAATAAVAADQPHYPADTVLMLVASWCAPCHAEIAHLDGIAAAARPHAVRVLLVEDGARARAMMRGIDAARRWEPGADTVWPARGDLMARTPGLPYSVVTDAGGRVCAGRGGDLDPARVQALIAQCGR